MQVCKYASMHVCMYVCMCVCMCVCVYVYIYIYTSIYSYNIFIIFHLSQPSIPIHNPNPNPALYPIRHVTSLKSTAVSKRSSWSERQCSMARALLGNLGDVRMHPTGLEGWEKMPQKKPTGRPSVQKKTSIFLMFCDVLCFFWWCFMMFYVFLVMFHMFFCCSTPCRQCHFHAASAFSMFALALLLCI